MSRFDDGVIDMQELLAGAAQAPRRAGRERRVLMFTKKWSE